MPLISSSLTRPFARVRTPGATLEFALQVEGAVVTPVLVGVGAPAACDRGAVWSSFHFGVGAAVLTLHVGLHGIEGRDVRVAGEAYCLWTPAGSQGVFLEPELLAA